MAVLIYLAQGKLPEGRCKSSVPGAQKFTAHLAPGGTAEHTAAQPHGPLTHQGQAAPSRQKPLLFSSCSRPGLEEPQRFWQRAETQPTSSRLRSQTEVQLPGPRRAGCRKAACTACLAGPATGRMGKKGVKQLFLGYHSYSRFQKGRQISPLPTLWRFSIGLQEKKIKPFVYISY